jgi:hypothetical protein
MAWKLILARIPSPVTPLLPDAALAGGPDLFDASNWPDDGLRPDLDMLAEAAATRRRWPDADPRCLHVVGTRQETVTQAERRGGQFRFRYAHDGDGTVPLESAQLPGAPLYVAPVAHGLLPRDDRVCTAVLDLLRDGHTLRLSAGRPRAPAAGIELRDSDLHQALDGKLDWAALTPPQRRLFLENLNDPGPLRPRGKARTSSQSRPRRWT